MINADTSNGHHDNVFQAVIPHFFERSKSGMQPAALSSPEFTDVFTMDIKDDDNEMKSSPTLFRTQNGVVPRLRIRPTRSFIDSMVPNINTEAGISDEKQSSSLTFETQSYQCLTTLMNDCPVCSHGTFTRDMKRSGSNDSIVDENPHGKTMSSLRIAEEVSPFRMHNSWNYVSNTIMELIMSIFSLFFRLVAWFLNSDEEKTKVILNPSRSSDSGWGYYADFEEERQSGSVNRGSHRSRPSPTPFLAVVKED